MIGLAVTAIAMAFAPTARATEIDSLAGRWSSLDLDECQYPDDSDAAPLGIAQDAEGTHIGTYGWLCTVRKWKRDGDILLGEAKACGQEGGEETFDQVFRLGLDSEERLVMTDGGAVTALRRCPPGP